MSADPGLQLARAIAAAQLHVPLREEGGALGVWATADDRGRTQVVAFTDAEAVEAWAGRSTPYAVMPGAELCRVAVQADAGAVWIDPGSPQGGRLDRRLIDVVAAGALPLRSDPA